MGMPETFDPKRHYKMSFTAPQSQFLLSTATYNLFVAGFGAGKSTTMAAAAVRDLVSYPGANIACYQPTFDLMGLITIPYISEILSGLGLKYNYHGGKQMFQVEGYGNIICRSLSNPGRIVGYEVFRSHIDELDTLAMEKAEFAWNKIIARNRQKVYRRDEKGNKTGIIEKNRVSAYTTPEGYLFCYHRWVKNKTEGYALYRAATYSNPHLPDDYIDNLRNTYPAELIDAYIEGQFVNLTSGSVYKSFDRELNHSDEEVKGREPLAVGMDFNVLYGAAGIHVLRNGDPILVDEITKSFDTDQTIATLKDRYPENPITIYPDASGDHRTSANTTRSDITKLKAAGFKMKVKSINPPIKNRVASMNGMLCSAGGVRRYKVNTKKCPEATAAFEQQIYDKNGMPDKSSGHDHIMDACGYYIDYEFGLVKPKSKLTVIQGAH